MKLIFDYKFRLYTSKLNEICLHCHWLYFSPIIMSFGQGVRTCTYSISPVIGLQGVILSGSDTLPQQTQWAAVKT